MFEGIDRFKTVQSPNRVCLFYVDEIPSELKRFCDTQNLYDPYDLDVVTALLERNATFSFNSKLDGFIYVSDCRDDSLEYIFLPNAKTVTSAHVMLLLKKFPSAQIVILLSTNDELLANSVNGLSVLSTNLHEMLVQNLRSRVKSPTRKRSRAESQNIDAVQIVNDIITKLHK